MKQFLKILLSLLIFSATLLAQDNMFERGKEIYDMTCIGCHGENGNTNQNMQLVIKPRKLSKIILTQEQSYKIIRDGSLSWGSHSDLMPSFKTVFEDDKMKAVAHYITKAFNSKREEKVKKLLAQSKDVDTSDTAKMLKVGEKIFKRNCSLCHGLTGHAESEYVEKSKSNKDFIYPYILAKIPLDEDQIFLYAKYGGHYWGADKDDMPSWKKKYDDFKLKSVAIYIHEKIKTKR